MFTGIIEDQAQVLGIKKEQDNYIFSLQSDLAKNFRIDESIAHNGVCLTVEKTDPLTGQYQVTAISETISKTMLNDVRVGYSFNLERALRADARLDGHFVQGHVDCTATIKSIQQLEGSTEYEVQYDKKYEALIIDRGSICINGISLTIARTNPQLSSLVVCIIPHTIQRTNIASLKAGDKVNLEFDVLGKYVEKLMSLRQS